MKEQNLKKAAKDNNTEFSQLQKKDKVLKSKLESLHKLRKTKVLRLGSAVYSAYTGVSGDFSGCDAVCDIISQIDDSLKKTAVKENMAAADMQRAAFLKD